MHSFSFATQAAHMNMFEPLVPIVATMVLTLTVIAHVSMLRDWLR